MSEHGTQGPGSAPERAPSRRDLLRWTAGGALAVAATTACRRPVRGAAGAAEPALASDLHYSSVRALAAALRRKQVSAEELVRAFLARIDQVNPQLNAFVQSAAERALAEARAADRALAAGGELPPLHGVPMTIKDSFDTAGVISTGGTKGRAAKVPAADATAVARLRRAGAILLGKTNTPELTLSFETDNLIYGRTSNPYDFTRSSGGSSGGAGALIAAGGTPFDLGTDYGGSVRLPSHVNGIAGIKPTFGRVPRTGHIFPFGGVTDWMQQVGPMARTVGDLALLLPIVAGPDGIDPGVVPMPLGDPAEVDVRGMRVSFHTDNGIAPPAPEIAAAVRAAARALEQAGAVVTEAVPDGLSEALELVALYFADGGAQVRRLLAEAGTTESTLMPLLTVPALSAADLDRLLARTARYRSTKLSYLDHHDVVLCPPCATAAYPHGTTADAAEGFGRFSYTMAYNIAGWPGTVVRAATSSEGLPIGVQVLAAPAREHVTLRVAQEIETALGGFVPSPLLP